MPKGLFSFDNDPLIPFNLNQVYEKPGDTKQVKCDICGASELEVGCGSYFTVLRCPKCRLEQCVHDG